MSMVILDVECYTNYFLLGFMNPETGQLLQLEKYDGHEFDATMAMKVMRKRRTFGFNSNNYDLPMIFLACAGLSNADLKRASDAIIVGDRKPWHIEKLFNVRFPKVDHVDLFDVAPGMASLKIYGGRLHSRQMQDLPIAPSAWIAFAEFPLLRDYNGNDLVTTDDLAKKLAEQITLREALSEKYGMDLRSKSDAQMAEAVIKSEIHKLTGIKPERPPFEDSQSFTYKAPEFIQFKTEKMQDLLQEVCASRFHVSSSGKPEMPPALNNRVVRIGRSAYRMGMGGLHSSEKCRAHYADEEYALIDRDVRSYYPSIILICQLFPKHLGRAFLKVYAKLVKLRLAAKDSGDTVAMESLKILINGTFGKLGSMWSCLYSPDLLIQVTLTGQLALLMLIESIELAGIRVISANTDGVVIKCQRSRESQLAEIIKEWEDRTQLVTEETRYSSVFSRDVNNYIAVYETPKEKKGKKIRSKAKGAYADPGLQKNPTNQICVTAVVEHLLDGTSIEDTIRECQDVRQFVSIRKVDGGALKDGQFIGKSIRWFYSTDTSTAIHYARNSNLVPRTEGAMPLLELPEDFPADVDYDWYIREARDLLLDIGVGKKTPVLGPRIQKLIADLV